MVALRSQGNWRWEGPLGTPLSGDCCAWESKVDGYWKQSIPCRRELLLPSNRNFSWGPLIGLLDHGMDSVLGRTGSTSIPFPETP